MNILTNQAHGDGEAREPTAELDVYLHGRRVGWLWKTADSQLSFNFGYEPRYVEAHGQPLSVALPLRREAYIGASARNWFAGLLPEGPARQRAAAQCRLTIQDDFGLLAAIGGECAGAVSVMPPGEVPIVHRGGDDPVEPWQVEMWINRADRGPILPTRGRQRLSLAGAQDKAAVTLRDDGRIGIMHPGVPSTHILKPPSARDEFVGLVEAEALAMRLAGRAGLPVAPVRLYKVPGAAAALLVDRYDRVRGPDGVVGRVHQEDVCQALGLPPESKYHDGGGPGLPDCFGLAKRMGLRPRSLMALVDWALFNTIIMNADAHAKNLSILHDREGRQHLAPFYDLVPTGLYEGIERSLAMPVGTARTLDDVNASSVAVLAHQVGVSERMVLRRMREIAGTVCEEAEAAAAELVLEGGSGPVLHQAARLLRERAGFFAGEASGLPPRISVADTVFAPTATHAVEGWGLRQ